MNFLINRKITISMLFIAATLLGVVSFRQLSVELLPDAELPSIYVSISSRQEVDPIYVESQIVIPLEGAIRATGGVERIESRVGSSRSTIQVDFKKNVNFRLLSLRLEEKIRETATTFPDGFTVQTQKVDLTRMAGSFMSLQVRGSGGVDRVRNVVDKEITADLENIDGIAAVSIYGGRERAIEIRLDPEACKALNLTTSRISSMLSQNASEKVYVGNVREPDRMFFVHVNSPFASVADIENVVVAPGPVMLKDVATVFFDLKEETSYSRVNGKDAISVRLTNDSQANIIDLSGRTLKTIAQLNERLAPHDVEIVVQENSAETMENNINRIVWLAITGGLLAIVILWFFLKNLRLVTIIALSIPISVCTAFNLFYAAGITVNSLTLTGITLAIGMLLDNSVVVIENIYRLSSRGLSPDRAVTQGTREVWKSVLAATLTTITVFLPFVFSDNFFIRLLGLNIGVSIISTLAISLLAAMIFVPMAAGVVLKSKRRASVFYEKISIRQRAVQIYVVLLKTCMRHPAATIGSAIVLLAVALGLSLSMNVTQMQTVESDRLSVALTMPAGSTLDATDKTVRLIESRLEDLPELEELISSVQEAEARLTLVLKPNFKKIRNLSAGDVKGQVATLTEDIKSGDIVISDAFSSGSNAGADMTGMENFLRALGIGDNRERIVIRGSDYDMMQMVAEDLQYFFSEQEYIQSATVSSARRQPEILLDFDPVLLISCGIGQNEIAQGLRSLEPATESGSTFKVGDEECDIIIRTITPGETDEEQQQQRERTADDLRRVLISNSAGGLHTLSDIATINYSRGRAQINRLDQDRHIELYYTFASNIQSSRTLIAGYRADIDALIADYNLPAGVAVEVFHEENQFADFQFLFLAAFLLIYMIMASVFGSLTTPFVLLLSIPLAATGSLLALLFTGNSLTNISTLTGFLILLGVAVNNSIILIDCANGLRATGYRRSRALIEAGLSRLRPILITSVTTIVAMLPLAMGSSEYSGLIGAPFAITVIGGLVCSTALTLILVPTACAGLENALMWYGRLSRTIKSAHAIIFALAAVAIWQTTDSVLWRTGLLLATVILIPSATWFILNSLRRANDDIIGTDSAVGIEIRNLVKIYDRPPRFARQWTAGRILLDRLGLSRNFRSARDFVAVAWQVALFVFLVWFTYFYLDSRLWIFLLSAAVYAFALHIGSILCKYISNGLRKPKAARRIGDSMVYIIPLVILAALFVKLENPVATVIIGVVWYFIIAVQATARYIDKNRVQIERIGGRFAGLRRRYFRMVGSIPLVGRRRRPFKALRGVSLNIGTGMFGLLGPNGAGKSTLMRILCGILNQSYGTVLINGLDTRVCREELQGLIGFLPQEFGTYENLTAGEFLEYQAILRGLTDTAMRRDRIDRALAAVHLTGQRDGRIGSFSGGMKQRIGIALILLHLPRILIVDEPTAGLDPRERIRFRNLLVELSRDRIVIFSTHIIEDISSSCSQVAVIDRGALRYAGRPGEMVNIAHGKVWTFAVDRATFDGLDRSLVVHHIQEGEAIRVRYLAARRPDFAGATEAEASLEDAYLCLLKGI